MAVEAPPRGASRFWLFAPFALLVLVMAAWSVGWFVVRERTVSGMDDWIAAEAAGGRTWTCRDRSVGGYPFRIRVTCAQLTARRGTTVVDLGPVAAVAQVYTPRHVIAEIKGPLRASDGATTVEGRWDLLDISVRARSTGLERTSLVMQGGRFTVRGPEAGEITTSSDRFEAHLRPSPRHPPEEGALDFVMRSDRAVIPGLDALLGGTEPATLETQMTVTRAAFVGPGAPVDEIERWRLAGGRIDLALLSIAKGSRRVEAKGQFALDDQRRPSGRLESATAAVEGFLGRVVNGTGGLMALLGARPAQAQGTPPADGLKPLPPIRLADGRLFLGPLPTPGVVVPPLY